MDNGEYSLPTPPPVLPGTTAPLAGESGENPFAGQRRGNEFVARVRRRIASVVAAIVALGAKFFAVIKGAVLLLPKAKLLTTAGTAAVSVAAYSLWFGWTFAVGFVLLLFVHEMGHVFQLRREGIKASAPMFIPFLGAVITSKSLGDDALAEARVGLAGPILGTAGAAVCLFIGEATNSDFFRALAYIGFFLNLINLVPLVPFDGGRAMAAMAPALWFLGLFLVLALMLLTHNLFLLIFVVLGGMETWRRWQARKTRTLEQAAYYRVSPRNRLLVGAVYIGLIALLAFGMHEAHILASGAHSFRSL
jgi:Zn-dependent protease